MRIKPAMMATALAIGLATAAGAETLRASEPQSFMDFFFEAGYPAQLSTDDYGDPLIEFRHENETYPLFFYDCERGENCLSVQLFLGLTLDEPASLARVNDWNSGERRFLRAYAVTDRPAVHLEMDIATNLDGISARDFADLLALWLDRAAEFRDFITE